MSDAAPQTYANHRRFDPPYHFVLFAVILLNLVREIKHLVQMILHGPFTWGAIVEALMAAAMVLLVLKVRTYALHNQDRLIRLEETLRMQAVLPEALKPRIRELRPGQFVGLRFASDDELAGLVEAALAEKLDGEAIKKRIKTWRPDTFRV
jgi:hypothetical protein